MLLSGQWFLPFWAHAGVAASSAEKMRISQAMRDIVRHFMTGNSYWDADFSLKRIETTRLDVRELLSGRSSLAKIEKIAAAREGYEFDFASETLSIVEMLNSYIESEPDGAGTYLSEELRRKVLAILTELASGQPELKLAYEEIKSSWDKWLRNATSSVPYFLYDFACELCFTQPSTKLFISEARAAFDEKERRELSLAYTQMSSNVLGVDRDIKFSDLSN